MFSPIPASVATAQHPTFHASATVPVTDSAPEFVQTQYTENRGDIVAIGIDLHGETNTTLRIHSNSSSTSEFSAELQLHDLNEDGQLTVRLNTYTLGIESGAITARGADTISVNHSTSLATQLKTGTYRLVLEASNQTVDESTLRLTAAGLDKLRVLTANDSGLHNLSTAPTIQTAIENDTFTEQSIVSTRDALLIELHASGLWGAIKTQPGPNTTTKFLNLLDTQGFSLSLRENESTINLEQDGNAFTLTPAATTIVARPETDTYYVLTQLGKLPRRELESGQNTEPELESGDLFDLNVTLDEQSGIVEHRETLRSQIMLVGWATVDTPVRVSPSRNQTITVQTSYEKGVPVKIVLKSVDGSFRFSRVADAHADGTVVMTFDLSNLTAPSKLTLAVVDESLEHVILFERGAVHVRSSPETPTPTITRTPPVRTATDSDASPTSSETAGDSFDTPTRTTTTSPGLGVLATVIGIVLAVALLLDH